jgi:DNA primase
MITEESVREVIDTARIEDVVGDFVNLRRRGQNMIGLCPFHNEKTPSFNVNPSRNIYKCFGCGEGGDPVKFLMTLEQLSFPDAIRWLADRYNLKLEEKQVSQEVRQERQEKESLLLVNDFARKWFEDQLYNTEEGKSIGLSYFKSRGFRRDVMEKFGLGYAPLQRDAFFRAATAAGYKEEQLEKLGLVRNKRDFFFDRVMFTIHNLGGKPIAFAGRILKKDAKAPKYVNSPETEVYHKSDVLYGLYQARRSVRKLDNVYMVEGYTDVISLHQHGIENVVATSGTSLTPGQARLIKRQTENVTLLYDGDKAGIKAALRGVDVLLVEGLNVRVVILPDGEDPDSYVQSVGTTAFGNYLEEQRQDFLFFKADLLLEEAGNDVAARTDAIRSIGATLALVDDPLKRAGYLQQFSGRLKIEESLLVSLVNQAIADRRKHVKKEQEREARRQQRQARDGNRTLPPPTDRSGAAAPPPGAGEEDQWAGLVEPGWGEQEIPPMPPPELDTLAPEEADTLPAEVTLLGHGHQEQHLVYLLIRDGHKVYDPATKTSIAAFLTANVADILGDFDQDFFREVVTLVTDFVRQHKRGPEPSWFLQHPQGPIQDLARTAMVSPYTYSPNWKEKYGLHLSQKPPEENQRLAAEIFLRVFRMEKIDRKVKENVLKIHELAAAGDEARLKKFLKLQARLVEMRKQLASELGTVVITK